MNAPVLQVPGTQRTSALPQWMKAFYWLIRREFWEHKHGLVWMPMFLGLLAAAGGIFLPPEPIWKSTSKDGFSIALTQAFAMAAELGSGGFLYPFLLIFVPVITVFSYCLDALGADRRDRSILFWKSLPSSDTAMVMSKASVALVISPLLCYAIYCIAAFLIVTFATNDQNTTRYFVSPLEILFVLPIQILWALPTVGWLLLVSAWARSKPFLWAVGIPIFAIWLAQWSNEVLHYSQSTQWLFGDVFGRLMFSGAFSAWFLASVGGSGEIFRVNSLGFVGDSWRALGLPSLWIGAISGIAMIAIAIRLRRWRTAD